MDGVARLGRCGGGCFGCQEWVVVGGSGYHGPADAFAVEIDRLWTKLKPLYLQLHAYVRARLAVRYPNLVTANGMIPAHLLGNLWAQQWGNIYDVVAPAAATPSVDATRLLRANGGDERGMGGYAGPFYT